VGADRRAELRQPADDRGGAGDVAPLALRQHGGELGSAAAPVTSAIFSTVYAGSTVVLQVETARSVALVHSTMTAPTGPMQGVNRARMTMVIVEEDERWAITQFHNALVVA
jgi:hypothetical protein